MNVLSQQAQPDNNLSCALIYPFHERYLFRLLIVIRLIDANCIDPQDAFAIGKSEVGECLVQVSLNFKLLAVTYNEMSCALLSSAV